MIQLEKNVRRLTDDEIEIIALRWARDKQYLNNRNVNCFIAGLEMARQWIVDNLSEFLMEEGLFMQNEYAQSRIEALGYSGIPLNEHHHSEFEAAKEAGGMLIEASRLMKENKVLT